MQYLCLIGLVWFHFVRLLDEERGQSEQTFNKREISVAMSKNNTLHYLNCPKMQLVFFVNGKKVIF